MANYYDIDKMFKQKSDEEAIHFWKSAIEEYEKSCRKFTNRRVVFSYILLSYFYLMKEHPVYEQNSDSMFKLLGATQKESGYQSAFFSIMNKAKEKYPEDSEFQNVSELEKAITNRDIDEIYHFYEWIIMQNKDEATVEKQLGQLEVSHIRFGPKSKRKVIIKHSTKKKEIDKVVRQQCEEFIREYTPEKIKEYLDRFIIGQDEAKKNISTAVYNHYLRVLHPEKKLIKSNVIMIGPSGCGKTEIIRRIMEIVDLPVIISDFSGVVATPWKGRNKEEALYNLYAKAGNNLALAECGIVFYDEFDKIIPVRNYVFGGDVNNELQGQMLGMMEGTTVEVPPPGNRGEKIIMNTENILFVCAGAFEGLEDIVRKDMPESNMAFGMPFGKKSEVKVTQENIKVEHLMQYGMKAELAGRIGAISVLKGLERDDLRRILTEPEDSVVARYKNEFWVEDEVELEFTDEAMEAIIDKVMEMNIGARALNSILHEVLADTMFEVPTLSDFSAEKDDAIKDSDLNSGSLKKRVNKVIITEEVVRDGGKPKYVVE